jgi:hypothetical protein
MQTAYVHAFADLQCSKYANGTRIGVEVFAHPPETFGPVNIIADQPFTFGMFYGEARFAENRDCAFMVSFTPEPGRSYVARFISKNEGGSCDVELEDHTSSPTDIEFATTEYVCGDQNVPNGGRTGKKIDPWDLAPIFQSPVK